MAKEMDDLDVTQDVFGMLELLSNHYGDGSIYLSNGKSNELLSQAIVRGYVNDEGYLTREGRKLVTQHRQLKHLY